MTSGLGGLDWVGQTRRPALRVLDVSDERAEDGGRLGAEKGECNIKGKAEE